jgi:phosphatidylethanolamine/phosphatidyl-N-methylethanolamine N-methyltransferase
MSGRFSEFRLFFREFRATFHTTGAVLPSGRALSWRLARFVRETEGPKRILEVGPGTGAVTRWIVDAMGPDDRLDLVELNDRFVARLRERFETDPAFRRVAEQTTIHHCPVQELSGESEYDTLISGLPLNNFSVELVESVLDVLGRLAKDGATLSFFEYIAIRKAKAAVSGRAERERLSGIESIMGRLLEEKEIARDGVWMNVPPAWVHHVRYGERRKA